MGGGERDGAIKSTVSTRPHASTHVHTMRRFTRPAPPLPMSLSLLLLLLLLPLPSPLACPKDHRPVIKTSNVSPTPSSVVPGIAVCTYHGPMDEADSSKVLSPDWMPMECTSYFYDGLTIDKTYFIKGTYSEADNGNARSLKKKCRAV